MQVHKELTDAMDTVKVANKFVGDNHQRKERPANVWKIERLPPGTHFFANFGLFRLSYFREFATDFPETSQVN